MPDLTLVTDYPPWSIDYKYKETNAVTRTSLKGYKRQDSYSHRSVTIAQAQRVLSGIELPYFEYFIVSLCNDGSYLFTDKYKDGSGVQTGTMRLVDGAYTVTFNAPHSYVVGCTLEIFR